MIKFRRNTHLAGKYRWAEPNSIEPMVSNIAGFVMHMLSSAIPLTLDQVMGEIRSYDKTYNDGGSAEKTQIKDVIRGLSELIDNDMCEIIDGD